MRALVTGGAGFIGSHLCDRLLEAGWEVRAYDDLSTGSRGNISGALARGLRLVVGDILDAARLRRAVKGCDAVFHLAANADVRFGPRRPRRDLEQNTIGTADVLEAMRRSGCRRIGFISTGSVYGEPARFPTPEDAAFPSQTSLYGASKLAGEALIQAYGVAFGFSGWIIRTVSVLGPRYSHGHVLDFWRQLRRDPSRLRLLGDGRQRKSYVSARDLVSGLLLAARRRPRGVHVYNLGTDEECTVGQSARWICGALGLKPRITHGGGPRGWPGDSPRIRLDCSRLRALGWRPTAGIRDMILGTLEWLRREAGRR